MGAGAGWERSQRRASSPLLLVDMPTTKAPEAERARPRLWEAPPGRSGIGRKEGAWARAEAARAKGRREVSAAPGFTIGWLLWVDCTRFAGVCQSVFARFWDRVMGAREGADRALTGQSIHLH